MTGLLYYNAVALGGVHSGRLQLRTPGKCQEVSEQGGFLPVLRPEQRPRSQCFTGGL